MSRRPLFYSIAMAFLALGPRPHASADTAPKLYLSWRQPYGMPRATDAITESCNDTTQIDTLFLSFDPGRGRPGLVSMGATLYFSPAEGDSIGDFWVFGRDKPNGGSLLIDFDRGTGMPCEQPWTVIGYGQPAYERVGGRGRLDLYFWVDPKYAQPLNAEERYCYARIRIQHKRNYLSGCRQPICVEWARARMKFTIGKEVEVFQGGSRFVSRNSRGGSVCRSYRGIRLARPWQPPKTVAKPPSSR